MFFKTLTAALTLALAVAVSSCGWRPFENLRFGDKNPAPGAIQVDLSKYSCMSQMGKKFDDYLSGRMTERDVRQFGGCVRTALHRFVDFFDTKTHGVYTPDELSTFLNRFYLHDQPLTPPLVREFMKIKILVLGGGIEKITSQEIDGLVDFVTFFENEAVANLPYVGLYMQNSGLDPKKVTRFDLSSLRSQLRQTGQHLADRLRAQGGTYDLQSLRQLISELQKFLQWDQYRPNSRTPDQIVDLFAASKAIVTGQDTKMISAVDWTMLLDASASLFGIWVDFQTQLRDLPLTYGAGLDSLIASTNEALALFGRIIDQNPAKNISFSATDKLFDALNNIQALPPDVRVDSVKDTYKFLIQKAFRNPLNSTRNESVAGLSWQELNEIHAEFYLWAEAQQYLSDNAKRSLGLKFGFGDSLLDPVSKAIEGFDFRPFIERGVDIKDSRSHEIDRIVRSLPAFFRSGDERAFIVPHSELPQFNVYDGLFDLTRMNVMRAFVRLLIRAAASDDRIVMMNKDWDHTGVTEDEMDDFFNKIRNLGIDLKVMDPRRTGVGRRSFTEGKLFTFAGNGINEPDASNSHLLNFVQTLELLSTIWSGGHVRDLFYDHIGAICRASGHPDGPPDVFGVPKLDRQCFLANFFANNLAELDNLPWLKKDFLARSPQDKQKIILSLDTIARWSCSDKNFIELGEIATMVTVLHYVESIFTVYDLNHDGNLMNLEVLRAFKRFSGYLARQIRNTDHKDVSVSMLKSIFVFLVSHQDLPSTADAAGLYWNKVRYFNNEIDQFEDSPNGAKSQASTPTVQLDRIDLLNVLKVLAKVQAQSAENNSTKQCKIQ